MKNYSKIDFNAGDNPYLCYRNLEIVEKFTEC